MEVGGAARGGSLWTGERAGHGQAGGSPIAGARKPALDVLQEKPELKRGSFKSKERFELKRHHRYPNLETKHRCTAADYLRQSEGTSIYP